MIRGRQFAARLTPPADPRRGPADPPSPNRENRLRKYFDANTTGNGIYKWVHYFDIYDRYLSKYAGRPVHVMEIGVYSGGSLAMWRDYFGEECQIYGVDIQPVCRSYEAEKIKIIIGDQADRAMWKDVRAQIPRLDVVIDDGGHEPEMQIVTLEELLPFLSPGGVYICEDVHGEDHGFAFYVQGLAARLNAAESQKWDTGAGTTACDATGFQAAVYSVHLYPFVVVVEKNALPVAKLTGERHGTLWQPSFR